MRTLFVLTKVSHFSIGFLDEKPMQKKQEAREYRVPSFWHFTLDSSVFHSFFTDSSGYYVSIVSVFPQFFARHMHSILVEEEIIEILRAYIENFVSRKESEEGPNEIENKQKEGIIVFLGVQDQHTWDLLSYFFEAREHQQLYEFTYNSVRGVGPFEDMLTFFASAYIEDIEAYDCLEREFKTIIPSNSKCIIQQSPCFKDATSAETLHTLN